MTTHFSLDFFGSTYGLPAPVEVKLLRLSDGFVLSSTFTIDVGLVVNDFLPANDSDLSFSVESRGKGYSFVYDSSKYFLLELSFATFRQFTFSFPTAQSHYFIVGEYYPDIATSFSNVSSSLSLVSVPDGSGGSVSPDIS